MGKIAFFLGACVHACMYMLCVCMHVCIHVCHWEHDCMHELTQLRRAASEFRK